MVLIKMVLLWKMVFLPKVKRVLLTKGCSLFRFRKDYHRSGIKVRRLVRGCIISNDIKNLHLKIIKKSVKPIEGLTEEKNAKPKRLWPKRATRILKAFGLTGVYTNITDTEQSEPLKEEYLIIEKVFLNTKVSINEIDVLKKRATSDEEKIFLMELFNLKELFENTQSKQFIMLDYYMNLYNLCIDNNFTLQQISTIMSIFYYIFSYSFCWVATEEKILEIYKYILSYHSLNNPPFSYQIFNKKQKNYELNFLKILLLKILRFLK